jgi:glucokinase
MRMSGRKVFWMSILGGVDIGGTKCSVSVGNSIGDQITILGKRRIVTDDSPHKVLAEIQIQLEGLLEELGVRQELKALGISCGGPLDSRQGVVLSPPNLPTWDRIDVVTPFVQHFSVPARLQNDANACALAEWKWGAGRGCRNFIFLTFGTGMGAGLILDGRLYTGTNDLAGEVGHIRMQGIGPIGYAKQGSMEGFCSGGGIANLAQILVLEQIQMGNPPSFCLTIEDVSRINAKKVAEAARMGDPLALRIFKIVSQELGRGLAILVDILNPEKIVIGGIYHRQLQLLEETTLSILREEALAQALAVCRVVPSELGENVGDFASLSVASSLLSG